MANNFKVKTKINTGILANISTIYSVPSSTTAVLVGLTLANTSSNSFNDQHHNAVFLDELRDDVVLDSSSIEKQLIIENFPKEKKGFLVVSKVIEE